jgi:hypothetical protein
MHCINHFKPKLAQLILKDLIRPSNRTSHFTITEINWLMLFNEIIAVNIENYTKPIYIKCTVTNC